MTRLGSYVDTLELENELLRDKVKALESKKNVLNLYYEDFAKDYIWEEICHIVGEDITSSNIEIHFIKK
jgi:hypothetical protein